MAEHNTLTGTSLHEPKGAATASAGKVYVADGAGSGSWSEFGGSTHGQMDVLNNATPISLTAQVDFDNPSNYIQVTGIWADPLSTTNHGITYASDALTVALAGTYRLEFWSAFTMPNNSDLAYKFAVNGTLGPHKVRRSATSSTDYGLVNGHSMVDLSAGDVLTIWTMSDVTGNLLIENGIFLVQLVHEA